jgi:Holliday junction resolvasome RuvABC endonuclease subunit
MNKTTSPDKIFCIDANTTSLAFSVYTSGKLYSFGKVGFEGNTLFAKITDAAKKTKSVIEMIGMVDAVVIEQSVFMNSPKTLIDLSMVQGAIISGAGMAGITVFGTVPPITWQTYLGNKKLTKEEQLQIRKKIPGKSVAWYKGYERGLRKERTMKLLEIIYDKKIEDNDVADACGIGHYAIHNWDKVSKVDK